MSKQQNVRDKVKLLVKAEPQCAANYNLLIVRYWMKYEGAKDLTDVIVGCTSAESITRAFRALITAGEISLDQKTAQVRAEQEAEFRKEYGSKPRQQYLNLD